MNTPPAGFQDKSPRAHSHTHQARRGGPAINVLSVIDDLEHLVESSKSMPLTHHKIVDEDAFFVLTQRLRNSLPEEIKKATELARTAATVVQNANDDAKRTVTDAQNEAKHIADDARARAERLKEDARERAERTIGDARREGERIVADAKQHAEQLLAEHVIVQRANETAEQTIEEAQHDSQELRQQAEQYAYDILDRAETILAQLKAGVQQGKNQIYPSAGASFEESGYEQDQPEYPTAEAEEAEN